MAQRRRRLGGVRDVGVGGIKICIDASQIYRGKGFLSVLALSPIISWVSFLIVEVGMSAVAGVAEKHSLHFERASRYNARPRRPSRRDLHIPSCELSLSQTTSSITVTTMAQSTESPLPLPWTLPPCIAPRLVYPDISPAVLSKNGASGPVGDDVSE